MLYKRNLVLSLVVLLAGCGPLPLGPSVAVMPVPGKPFDLFMSEENQCRHFAGQQVGFTPGKTLQDNTISGALVGAARGAAVGTAIGAASGDIGEGAIVGAGLGLLGGAASGANAGGQASWELQQRYDIAYQQCMYAKGNQLPGQAIAYSRVEAY